MLQNARVTAFNIAELFREIQHYSPPRLGLRKKKWLLVCCYNPHKGFSKDIFTAISKEIDPIFSRFENFLVIGYFCEIRKSSV